MSLIDFETEDRQSNPVDMIEQIAGLNDWSFERSGDDEVGPVGLELLREVLLPHVRGLDDVIVDADDLGQLGHGVHPPHLFLTDRQILP